MLEYDVAADVLNFLPVEVRPEVLQRVASLETVQPSAMEELEGIMKKQFASSSSAKSSSFGGVKAAAKIDHRRLWRGRGPRHATRHSPVLPLGRNLG